MPKPPETLQVVHEAKDDEKSQRSVEKHTKESEGASLYKREFLYEMYFKPDEIQNVHERQNVAPFDELIRDRERLKDEKSMNMIDLSMEVMLLHQQNSSSALLKKQKTKTKYRRKEEVDMLEEA